MRVRPWVVVFLGVVIQGPAKAGPYEYYGSADAARSQEPQPTFRTEANYVRVDVYPTQNGAPLTDLHKDDFELVE
jgi:hypothetical protein